MITAASANYLAFAGERTDQLLVRRLPMVRDCEGGVMRFKIMMAVLWAAGLCVSGCMTEPSSTESSAPEESVVDQDVSTGVRCSDKTWRVDFFSDATLTTQVGSMSCVCFRLEQLTGTTSNFTRLAYEFTCDLR